MTRREREKKGKHIKWDEKNKQQPKEVLLIGYQNRVDSKRSHPVRKFWNRTRCWKSDPCSARPNGLLGMIIRAS